MVIAKYLNLLASLFKILTVPREVAVVVLNAPTVTTPKMEFVSSSIHSVGHMINRVEIVQAATLDMLSLKILALFLNKSSYLSAYL